MSWYPTHSEVTDAETRVTLARESTHLRAQQLRTSLRARFGRPALLVGAAVGLLLGMLITRRRLPQLAARTLVLPASAFGQIAKAMLISFGTRSLTRLLLQRRTPAPAHARRSNGGETWATTRERTAAPVRRTHHTHH